MSAPLIWIVFPLLAATILWFVNRQQQLVFWVGAAICLVLAVLAQHLPVGRETLLASMRLEISPFLFFFGRRFILDASRQPYLVLLYGFAAVWFMGGQLAGAHRYFVPIGLSIIALLVAALAVEPFLYGALLIQIAVLISIPMLTPPGQAPGQGVLRYIIFQTLAIPFILFAGWAAAGVEANPADQRMLSQALLLLGLGFAFWLAIFPFYHWVPLLAEKSNSYAAGFILSLIPVVILLLMLHFMENYTWLRDYRNLQPVLRWIGLLMVVTGGIWAAFQQDLRRLFGYAVIIENGFSLLALSLGSRAGLEIYVASLLPRLVTLWLLAYSLTLLAKNAPADFSGIAGLFYRYPFISSALIVALLSLSGLPLLAGYPLREALIIHLGQRSLAAAIWLLAGSAGFIFCVLRAFSVMLTAQEMKWTIQEGWLNRVFLSLGIAVLFLLGLLPRSFLTAMINLLQAFGRLY
ncbi:MAG: proton-conducting transporter membrane subunit [Anaerolineaceae bacterium]|jgi:NADH:ubiquinone oxidoreductase subunit 2 (subunit N)